MKPPRFAAICSTLLIASMVSAQERHVVNPDLIALDVYAMRSGYDDLANIATTLPYGTESGAGTTASTKTDLDSKLRILIQGGDFGDILAEEFLDIDWNIKTNRYGTWKLKGGVDTDATVYTKLASALDEAELTALKDQLQAGIDNLDSYALELLLAPEGQESVGLQFLQIRYAAQRGKAAALALSVARSEENSGHHKESQEAGLSAIEQEFLASAVDNRGKLTFSAKHEIRRGVVGPDQTTIAINYERGLGTTSESLQRFISANSDCLSQISIGQRDSLELNSQVGLECLSKAASMTQMLASAKEQERIGVKLEYSDIDDFFYEDADSMFSQQYPGTYAFSLSASYGRRMAAPISNAKHARLDASLTFDDVKDNEQLNDRGLLQVTYTVDFGDFEVPIALTWSNKSELVGEADAKIGGHIGIQYRPEKNSKNP